MALIEKLNTIANAIRNKTGGTETMTLDEMAEAIDNIKNKDGYSKNDDVCFWDYEGTLIYSCSLAEA